MYFEKNIPLTKSILNDVIFAEKPYEMGIIQILIREWIKDCTFIY